MRIRSSSKNKTAMCNDILHDNLISLSAKALFCYYWSLPDDWRFNVEVTCLELGVDAHLVCKCHKELVEQGYMVLKRERDASGRMGQTQVFLYECPSDNHIVENHIVEKPHCGKTTLWKNATNTKLSKDNLIYNKISSKEDIKYIQSKKNKLYKRKRNDPGDASYNLEEFFNAAIDKK